MLRSFGRSAGAVHGHVGAGLRQTNRDGRTQASRRTGYKCGFAFEIEFVEC
jgi:hypothetical protein